jgi:hypothetical protein
MTAQPLKTIVLDLLQQGHLAEAALHQQSHSGVGCLRLWFFLLMR